MPRYDGVLFDRDGTLVVDVPYNGDPSLVEPIRGAREGLQRLRAAGVRVGVVSNQSGVGRGAIALSQMHAVNHRVIELLGPFDGWYLCPHAPQDACLCRKPQPLLVVEAALEWGVRSDRIAVIGDKQSDVEAAQNAGGSGFLIDGADALARAIDAVLA